MYHAYSSICMYVHTEIYVCMYTYVVHTYVHICVYTVLFIVNLYGCKDFPHLFVDCFPLFIINSRYFTPYQQCSIVTCYECDQSVCMYMCVCVCVRACVRACVCVHLCNVRTYTVLCSCTWIHIVVRICNVRTYYASMHAS